MSFTGGESLLILLLFLFPFPHEYYAEVWPVGVSTDDSTPNPTWNWLTSADITKHDMY